jgi:anti-sigma28 factor (negative regulator of flagellin synthesis)
MRIDPKVVVPISVGEQREQAPTSPPKTAPTSSTVVDISSAGTAAAAQAASETGDPKITTRIAQIKGMLQAGAYPIDLEKLASRIVDDDLLRGGVK